MERKACKFGPSYGSWSFHGNVNVDSERPTSKFRVYGDMSERAQRDDFANLTSHCGGTYGVTSIWLNLRTSRGTRQQSLVAGERMNRKENARGSCCCSSSSSNSNGTKLTFPASPSLSPPRPTTALSRHETHHTAPQSARGTCAACACARCTARRNCPAGGTAAD